MNRMALILVVPLLATPLAATERFVVDTEHSRIGFSVPYDFMILGELEGEFREFSGELFYDAADPSSSELTIQIDTSSVDTRFEARDIGLRGEDYLDSDSYPKATFVGREVIDGPHGALLRGELTMHGVTRPVDVEFDLLDLGETLVVRGRSGLSREAFEVSGPDLSDEILIGDQVSLSLHMVFRRPTSTE